MGFRIAGLLSSSSDGTQPESNTIATARQHGTPSRSTVDTGDQLAHLAESERMLRTAIEALSPDKDEILESLCGEERRSTADVQPPLNFRLILAVVVLLVLILALDLLMAGG